MTDQIHTSETDETKTLTSEDLQHVVGGAVTSGGLFVLVDGSVRTVSSGDYALWRANYGSGG